MTTKEKREIDKTKDLILNNNKNNQDKINKSFNIIQSNISEKPVNETAKPSISHMKRNISIISILVFFAIIVVVLIIGHFKYGWFRKKNDLVIIQNREVYLVSGFSENKSATNYYDLEKDKIIKNNDVLTDFIVGINKKTKINSIFDFSEEDYLYESFLLIVNITLINETDSINLGGLNIFDESKSAEDLIKLNDEIFLRVINSENSDNNTIINKTSFIENIPLCKFYYYKNGTIDGIYCPEGMDNFYKSAIADLIEKVTPKLSKSLYLNKNSKRRLEDEQEEGIKFNYEQILKNDELEKIILYEDKLQKESKEKNKEINSKIIRTFNSSGDITSLKMEGEAIFKSFSPKKNDELKNTKNKNLRFVEEIKEINYETNNTYDNFGINEFRINVTSNMELIYNKIEPKIIKKLNDISKSIIFEKYKDSYEILTHTKGEEKTLNNSEETNDLKQRTLAENSVKNFPRSYTINFNLYNKYFLGLRIGLEQTLEVNHLTDQRKDTIKLILGSSRWNLHEISILHDYNEPSGKFLEKIFNGEKFGLEWGFSVFGFGVKSKLYLPFKIKHGINYRVNSGLMYTKGYASYEINVKASYGPSFCVVSYGSSINGKIASGNSYIEGNSILGSDLARFEFYKDFIPTSVNLYFYFTVNIFWWKKTFDITMDLYIGHPDHNKNYRYE